MAKGNHNPRHEILTRHEECSKRNTVFFYFFLKIETQSLQGEGKESSEKTGVYFPILHKNSRHMLVQQTF